jgi:hypothetical protein
VAEEAERERVQEAEHRRVVEVRATNRMHTVHAPPTCSFVGVHPQTMLEQDKRHGVHPNSLALINDSNPANVVIGCGSLMVLL